MKKILRLVLVIGFLVFSFNALAQYPPHPPTDPSVAGNLPVGGTATAPIGSGTLILLTLAIAYGGWKMYPRHSAEAAE